MQGGGACASPERVACARPAPARAHVRHAEARAAADAAGTGADMGWFGRGAPQRPPQQDAVLTFLSTDDAAYLRRLVADEMARGGVGVTVHDDHLAGDDGMTYGLWNVAATCYDAGPRERWPEVVAGHVARILDRPPAPGDLSVDELLERAVLRVVAPQQIPDEFRDRFTYAVPVAEGLLQILVADFPQTVATLGDEDVARAGHEQMHAAGRAHLLAEPVDHETVVLTDGARVELFTGGSVYVASRVLVLDEVLRSLHGGRTYPDGVLVGVPDRHTLVLHVPVDGTVVHALNWLVVTTAETWSTAVGGVSPSVYWWRDGTLTRISRVDGERVAVDVTGDLDDVLSRLVAG